MSRLTKAIAALAATIGSASGEIYRTRFDGVTWDMDNWIATTTELDQGHYQSRMSLANGYLGINIATVGPFFEVDTPVAGDQISGWPLFNRRQTFATITGFYDLQPTTNGTNFEWLNQYGGESVISGVPHWAGLVVEASGQVLDASVPASQVSNFTSSMDFSKGLLTWSYTWSPSENASIDVEYSMFVHKLHVNQAVVQLKLTPSCVLEVTVTDVFNGDGAVRTDFVDKRFETDSPTIWSAVRPNGIPNVTAYIYSTLKADENVDLSSRKQPDDRIGGNQSSIAQTVSARLSAGKATVIEKYIGGASTDAFDNPQSVAQKASKSAAESGFDELLTSHIAEWNSILTEDSVDNFRLPDGSLPDDDNLLELQILAVTNPFHLLQNTVGQNAILAAENNTRLDVNSISVCGLGSDCYAGFIFWDTEVWMAPGLVVSHPEAVKQVANYRVGKFTQAKENIKTAYTSSQNETGKFSDGGAVFPWTGGRFGNCTGTGPCFDYEYHLNGDIALELFNYLVASGDLDFFGEHLFPIYDAVAVLYADLVSYNESSSLYVLTNATDPDEYANHVDNAGFTMVLIQTHLKSTNKIRKLLGIEANSTWDEIADKIDIPIFHEANIILEYEAMNGSISVKQADVVLVDDFLDFPNPYSLSNLDYYAGKQSPNGPGMTYGVFSIVANKVSPSGCSAYTYDIYSSQPYVRAPWFQFSEQLLDDYTDNGGTHPAYPFLTGIGGANRVTIFGYLGLRLLVESLNVDPNLPPPIPRIDYRTFYWQGHAINATSNQTHTTLTRLPLAQPNANPNYTEAAIPVTIGQESNRTFSLEPNGTLTITNRRIGLIETFAGNVAQCKPVVSSSQEYAPGQIPLAAVDGAISTTWQPAKAAEPSWITVELTPNKTAGTHMFYPIVGFRFDWAQEPPVSYNIIFSNVSLPPFDETAAGMYVNVTSSSDIKISAPYNPEKAAAIVPYVGNQTNVTLERVAWSGRYVTLIINGNQADRSDNATGATVAEFAVIREGSGHSIAGRTEDTPYRTRRYAPW